MVAPNMPHFICAQLPIRNRFSTESLDFWDRDPGFYRRCIYIQWIAPTVAEQLHSSLPFVEAHRLVCGDTDSVFFPLCDEPSAPRLSRKRKRESAEEGQSPKRAKLNGSFSLKRKRDLDDTVGEPQRKRSKLNPKRTRDDDQFFPTKRQRLM